MKDSQNPFGRFAQFCFKYLNWCLSFAGFMLVSALLLVYITQKVITPGEILFISGVTILSIIPLALGMGFEFAQFIKRHYLFGDQKF